MHIVIARFVAKQDKDPRNWLTWSDGSLRETAGLKARRDAASGGADGCSDTPNTTS